MRPIQESNWKELGEGTYNEDAYFKDNMRRYSEILEMILSNAYISIRTKVAVVTSNILEISPLFGHIAITLKVMGYDVSVTDIQSQVERRIEKFKHYNIPILKCDLDYNPLPFPNCSFDYIVFSEVFEHIQPFSTQKALDEICRVLKPHGKLFFSTPNLQDLGNRLLFLLGKTYLDPAHVKEYSFDDLVTMFRRAGFGVIYSKYSLCYAYHHSLGKWWANACKPILLPIRVLYPRFRTTIFLIGEKPN